jgi:hypothetical protein
MRRIAVAVPLTALLLVAGCSGDSKDAPASAPGARGGNTLQEGADSAGKADAPADPAATGAQGEAGRPTTIVNARVRTAREHIIKNAFLRIEATDVDRARNEAVALTQAAGGDVASEQRSGTDDGRSATLVLRVPPEDFDALVTNLGKLGKVLDTKTETEDVTAQVADIEGRIRAAQDSAAQIRKLISRANAISDIVALEREYQARDAEIQSMSAQLASLKDRAGRSTVTLTILQPAKGAVAEKDEEITGFFGGLDAGWSALVVSVTVLLTILGALLPFLVVAAIGLAVWLPIRRRRPRATPPTPDQPTAWPAAP